MSNGSVTTLGEIHPLLQRLEAIPSGQLGTVLDAAMVVLSLMQTCLHDSAEKEGVRFKLLTVEQADQSGLALLLEGRSPLASLVTTLPKAQSFTVTNLGNDGPFPLGLITHHPGEETAWYVRADRLLVSAAAASGTGRVVEVIMRTEGYYFVGDGFFGATGPVAGGHLYVGVILDEAVRRRLAPVPVLSPRLEGSPKTDLSTPLSQLLAPRAGDDTTKVMRCSGLRSDLIDEEILLVGDVLSKVENGQIKGLSATKSLFLQQLLWDAGIEWKRRANWSPPQPSVALLGTCLWDLLKQAPIDRLPMSTRQYKTIDDWRPVAGSSLTYGDYLRMPQKKRDKLPIQSQRYINPYLWLMGLPHKTRIS